jgi:hypothetical protein
VEEDPEIEDESGIKLPSANLLCVKKDVYESTLLTTRTLKMDLDDLLD